jgi:hypothetical protein
VFVKWAARVVPVADLAVEFGDGPSAARVVAVNAATTG